jgi:hypothetical protein
MVCRTIFVPVLGLALAGMACATTTFYTSQSLFNTATAGMTFTTISDLASSELSSGAPLTDPSTGVVFSDQTGNSGDLSVINTGELKVSSGFSLGIEVPSTYTAYWFDIVTVNSGGTVNESSSSPSSSDSFTTAGTPVFFGIVTDTAVTGLQLAGSSGIEIDNFNVASSGSSDSAPEGATMMMIGGGLILLRALRVRRLQAPA